jgi:hypothetical protein
MINARKFLIAAALLGTLHGCKDQGPEGAPDLIGTITQVSMGPDRVEWLFVENVTTPAGVGRVKVNVGPKTKVVWYSTGKDVYYHSQNIQPGLMVRAYASGGLSESNPPQLNPTRIELSAQRSVTY